MVYPALLPLMRTPRVPVVDWTDAPADLNGLVRFAERRNLVSARVPSHFKSSLLLVGVGNYFFLILFQGVRGGAVCWGAALQAGKVAGSIFDLGFFKDLILRATLLPCGRLNLWQKWVPVVSSRSKGRSLRGAGNIATFMCRLSRAGMANLWHSGRFSLELGFHCWPKLFLSNQRLYIVKNICLYLTS